MRSTTESIKSLVAWPVPCARESRNRGAATRLRLVGLFVGLSLVVAACSPMGGDAPSATRAAVSPPSTSGTEPTSVSSEQSPTTSLLRTSTTVEAGLPIGGPDLEGAPAAVATRVPLPYCGADIEVRGRNQTLEGLEHDEEARECFTARVEAGHPAEMVQARLTIEGDWIIFVLRLLPDGSVRVYTDATRDGFGARAWFVADCRSIDTSTVQPVGCTDQPLQLTTEPFP